MRRREAIIAIGLTASDSAPGAPPPARARLIGVWKLIGCDRTAKNGQTDKPLGDHPVGRIVYDPNGRVSVQLMRAGRSLQSATTRTSWEAAASASCDELREMISGYIAYFGTYEVNEASRTINHHVLGALIPTWVGTDRKRTYEFSGEQMILNLDRGETVERYVWERDLG